VKYKIHTTSTFDKWVSKLKDRHAAKAIAMRLDRAINGNLGDVQSVGGLVSEMRIFIGKGYRGFISPCEAMNLFYYFVVVTSLLNNKILNLLNK